MSDSPYARPKQQNPYLTERGKAVEGAGFDLGEEGAVLNEDQGEEGDVVGIEIVADEPRVCMRRSCVAACGQS